MGTVISCICTPTPDYLASLMCTSMDLEESRVKQVNKNKRKDKLSK